MKMCKKNQKELCSKLLQKIITSRLSKSQEVDRFIYHDHDSTPSAVSSPRLHCTNDWGRGHKRGLKWGCATRSSGERGREVFMSCSNFSWVTSVSVRQGARRGRRQSPTYFLRSLTGATLYWLTEWSGIRFRMRHGSGLIGRCVELGVHWKDHMERRRRAYETKPLSEARTKAKQFNPYSVRCANSPMTWIKSLDGFLRSCKLQPRYLELINWIIDCPPQANTVLMRCVFFWWFYLYFLSYSLNPKLMKCPSRIQSGRDSAVEFLSRSNVIWIHQREAFEGETQIREMIVMCIHSQKVLFEESSETFISPKTLPTSHILRTSPIPLSSMMFPFDTDC